MIHRHQRTQRRGSALLVCTLAAAVLSMASIAILRSTQRQIASVDALRASAQGRCAADGLLQRSIAILRNDSTAQGIVTDRNGMPQANSVLTRLAPNATRIQVFLYTGSTIPAIDTVVDPGALAGNNGNGGNGGGNGNGNNGNGNGNGGGGNGAGNGNGGNGGNNGNGNGNNNGTGGGNGGAGNGNGPGNNNGNGPGGNNGNGPGNNNGNGPGGNSGNSPNGRGPQGNGPPGQSR